MNESNIECRWLGQERSILGRKTNLQEAPLTPSYSTAQRRATTHENNTREPFYWDLGWLDGMECLIRALYEVVKWCCSRYLKWMFSIYVTCASRLRMREYCWSPVFGRTLKEDSVD